MLAFLSLAALASGCWSYTRVFTPARSDAGDSGDPGSDGVGFGTLVHVRAMYAIFAFSETRIYLTGMAGASGDGITYLADGTPLLDAVWRVRPPGWGGSSLAMDFCVGHGESADCREAEFVRPEGISDFGFLSIIDPVNLGAMLIISRSSGGGRTTTYASGSLTVHTAESPITPLLGVWVAPAIGTVFHCMLEPSGPRCRPAFLDGRPLQHTQALAVHTLRNGPGNWTDVLWEQSRVGEDDPVRCVVDGMNPEPVCARVMSTRGDR